MGRGENDGDKVWGESICVAEHESTRFKAVWVRSENGFGPC